MEPISEVGVEPTSPLDATYCDWTCACDLLGGGVARRVPQIREYGKQQSPDADGDRQARRHSTELRLSNDDSRSGGAESVVRFVRDRHRIADDRDDHELQSFGIRAERCRELPRSDTGRR